ncbi:MAG: hypothetical protein ACRD0O_13725 [Acidimicrobiia bacterium]
MFKRMRWIAMGMGVGATGSVWVRRRLRRFLKSYTPPAVATRAAASARDEFKAAWTEGREAMRQREAELRGDATRRARPTGSLPGPTSPQPTPPSGS